MQKDQNLNAKFQSKTPAVHATPQSESRFLRSVLEEHRDIISHIEIFKETQGSKTLASSFARLRELILNHTQAEEEFFYPLFTDLGFDYHSTKGVGAHRKIQNILSKMENFGFEGSEYKLFIRELEELLALHISEEEEIMFPIIRDNFSSDELKSLEIRYNNFIEGQQKIAS